MTRLVTSASCIPAPHVPHCDWTCTGPDPARVDLEARRHTGHDGLKGGPVPAHPTVVESGPRSAGDGLVLGKPSPPPAQDGAA